MKRRGALLLVALGVVLAGGASLLVFSLARQANESGKAGLPQVYVLMATRDLPDQAQITPDALVMRPFPADFVPAGAAATPEQVVGKFTLGPVFRDQIILTGQVSTGKRTFNLSDRIPPGKVISWLPLPEILNNQVALRPGDRLDILLTLPLGGDSSKGGASTQTTLQNVEIFSIGSEVQSNVSGKPEAAPARTASAVALGFLVDHQDAVIIKYIKDSGGVIDLVIRSIEEDRIVRTDAMTLDSVAERFRFRVPQAAQGARP